MDHPAQPPWLQDTSRVPASSRPAPRPLADEVGAAVDTLRARPPRLHALMPTVSQPIGANIAAALGIDISMTSDPDGVAAMAQSADAVLVNLGMLDAPKAEAARRVAAGGVLFVLDPVKVDRDPARLSLARELAGNRAAIIKGNRAEMAALAGAVPPATVAVTTGRDDIVTEGQTTAALCNGTPLLDRVIGTGCATGLLATALLAATHRPFVSAVAAVALMGIAGERAAQSSAGPGSFATALIDALWALDGKGVASGMRLV